MAEIDLLLDCPKCRASGAPHVYLKKFKETDCRIPVRCLECRRRRTISLNAAENTKVEGREPKPLRLPSAAECVRALRLKTKAAREKARKRFVMNEDPNDYCDEAGRVPLE